MVLEIRRQKPMQVSLAPNDDVVEQLSADQAHQTFAERIPVNYRPAGTSSDTFFCTATSTGAVFGNPAWLKKTPTN
jgi:hypothetical protein